MLSILLLAANYLLMMALPLALATLIQRRRRPGWGLFGIGAVAFVAAQILHIPFNYLVLGSGLLPQDTAVVANLLLLSIFLGLSAGLFEEVARYLAYRFWARSARAWSQGLMLGAGHGGIEAILLGLLAGVNFAVLLVAQRGGLAAILPPEALAEATAYYALIFEMPRYLLLFGALERLFALALHLAASLLVMQVFVRGQWRWLFFAIGWHALLNAVAVFVNAQWGAVAAEVALGLLSLGSLAIIFGLRPPAMAPEPEPLPAPPPPRPQPARLDDEALERSKYL
jgi:uncharacterized membrane protein YhfC